MAPLRPLQALHRPTVIVILVIVALLVALRIALPVLVTNYANGVLQTLPGYEGHIANVDLHLWRGASTIREIELYQIDNGKKEPLFYAPSVSSSVSWRALLRGSLVAEVEVVRPNINIIAAAKPEELKEEKLRLEDLVDRFRELLPFVIDRFAVVDGQFHFRDFTAQPDIDIYIEQLQLLAQNLTNSERLSSDLWGTVSLTGLAMGSGKVQLEMRVNPNETNPTYDLAFELQDLSLPTLNNYLKHYLSVVARDGRLSLYAESTAREGRFKGYVKPVVKNLDVLHVKQEKKSVAEAVKGFFVKLIASIFENDPKQQIATRVEFSGKFENPQISVWEAAIIFVRNAFVQALYPGLDASVAPRQAEKAERAVFGKGAGERGERGRREGK